MPDDQTLRKLVTFIDETLCPQEMEEPIRPDTPLLELGILDSLKTAILLNFIRDALGVVVPPKDLSARNFKNPAAIAAMVDQLSAAPSR
ncbi:acyl carrier protein [Phytohabitans suffuscus]|uniref:acyl carrier protein n=1 Tax=Phytohabitans suffuscus TaxID=624315 RepID=UPI0015668532|nr:acyl carrier protein [Phytohabitans suffuscus]